MPPLIKFISIIYLFALLPSCSNKFLPGEYAKSVNGLSYEAFKLKSDSTFEYIYRAGWNKSISNGKWMLRKNTIVLNSRYKRESLPIEVSSSHIELNTGYTFNFKNFYSPKENPTLWQVLIINDKDSFRIDKKIFNVAYPGVISKFKIETVTSEYLSDTKGMYKLTTENYMVKSGNENVFLVDYPFEWNMSYYRNFDDEELIIKNNSAYWPEKNQTYNLTNAGAVSLKKPEINNKTQKKDKLGLRKEAELKSHQDVTKQ